MKSIPPIHQVTGYMTGNIYIIEGEELVLVDTGVSRDFGLIVDRIKSLGRSPKEIGHIFLTHFHIDHAGSAAALKELSGARVYAHRDDVPFIQGDDMISSVYKRGVLGRAASLFPKVEEKFTQVPSVEVDRGLLDGEVVPVLGGIMVIHSPGHTPGSACYLWDEKGILFTGDSIINSYHFLSLGTIGFSCDFEQAADSACGVVGAVESRDIKMVCCGHGPIVNKRVKDKMKRLKQRLSKRGKP